jgi:hypothetical protein
VSSQLPPGFGLAIIDTRLSSDTIAAKGVGVLQSAYTESGPIPGHPSTLNAVPTSWRPQVSQAQSASIASYTIRGGYPGRDGASVLMNEGGGSQNAYRGWDEPVTVTDWSAPGTAWGPSTAWTSYAAAVIEETGVIVVTGCDGSANAQTWSYNPRSGAWTDLYDWDAGALDGLRTPLGMAYDRDRGRLLLWSGRASPISTTAQLAYYSDDGGTTWALYSRGFAPGQTGVANGAWRVVPHSSGDWLCMLLTDLDGTGTSTHLASSDRGVSWELVTSDSGGAPSDGTAAFPVLGPAGFVIAYIDSSAGDIVCKVIASARASINDAPQIVIDSTRDYSTCWACVDADGIVYVYALGTSAASLRDQCWAWRSLDGGTTWEQYTWGLWNMTSNTRYPQVYACLPSSGHVHLVHTQIGDTDTDFTLQTTALGGWSNVATGPGTDEYKRTSRIAWGHHTSGGLDAWGALWLPWAFPENLQWTRSTGTGTRTFGVSFGTAGLELTTTAGQGEVYFNGTSTNADYCCGQAILQVGSTGSATLATIGTANTGVHVRPALRDIGVYGYAPFIDFGSDGIQVRDGATIRASVSIDCTAQPVYVRWHLTKGSFWLWYKLNNSASWVILASGVTVTDAGAGTATDDRLIWGQETTAVGHAVWRMVAGSVSADLQYSVDGLAELGGTSATAVLGHQFGRPLPGAGTAYPFPDGTATTSEDLSLLSASGGPTYVGESVSLPVAYTYAVGHVHPTESPSPSLPWRATGTSEVRLVWDQGTNGESWYGGAMALVALQGDWRTAVLQRDNGAGGTEDLGTLDKGWGSILYTRTGRTIVPRTGTATIDRYLEEGELVGGYVVMNTAGSDVARRITRQSAGYWSTSAVQQVVIELEGIDASETSAGSGQIVHHSGVLVVYPATNTPRRYVIAKITSAQTVPGGVYSAGILAPARIVGVGADPSWQWSREIRLARRVTRGPSGVPQVLQTGRPRQIMSYSWPDGIDLRTIRRLSTPAPWISGVPPASPIGSAEDAWSSPARLIADQLRSGEVPCVVIPRLPQITGTTITDQTLYTYGVAMVDGVTVSGRLGTEGLDEIVTATGLTVEGVP